MKKKIAIGLSLFALLAVPLLAVEEDNITASDNVNGSKSGDTDITVSLKNTQNRKISSASASGYEGKEAEYSNSSARTKDIDNNTKFFISYTLTLSGNISSIGGSGGTETYSATQTKKGEFYIEPLDAIIAKGDSATFTAKKSSDDQAFSVSWKITKQGGRQVQPATGTSDGTSITSLSNFDADIYTVTATEASGKTATATLKVFDISVTADGNELLTLDENKRYAYIASSCTMPGLKAKLVPSSLTEDVEYDLKITYTRSGRKDSNTYSVKTKADKTWDINSKMANAFRGGKAILTYKYKDASKDVTFYIRGDNPSKTVATSYINGKTSLWYPQYVAIHESGSSSDSVMKQFNETGTFNSGNSDIQYTPNASFDGGFGIFQLTNPVPNAQQLWSWKANCDEGISRLNSAQAYANNWMQGQRQQMRDEGYSIAVPTKTYGNVTFKEKTAKTIEHAVALKRYNGASGGNFCAWNNSTAQWKFNENNNLGFNYVSRICRKVP